MRVLSIHDYILTNTGYAQQMKALIPPMVEKFKYQWYTMSPQRPVGRDQPIDDLGCIDLSSGFTGSEPTMLAPAIRSKKIDVCMVVDDIQRLNYWGDRINQTGCDWFAWFPKDNEEQIDSEIRELAKVPFKITYSKFASDLYASLGLDIPYVYLPINPIFKDRRGTPGLERFLEKNAQLKAIKESGYSIILWVGRSPFHWRKNLTQLFGAMHILKERGVKVICLLHTDIGDEDEPTFLEKMLEAMDIREIVAITGMAWHAGISEEALSYLYSCADAYVNPHGGEGFGIPMAEAMACGTPVIATDYSTTREMLGEEFERGIPVRWTRKIVEKGIPRPLIDKSALADEIQFIIENPTEAREMGKRASEFATRMFNQEVIAAKMHYYMKDYEVSRCTMA